MIEQADVFVNNLFGNDVNVARKLPNGSTDYETTITAGANERIPVQGTEASLVISLPTQVQDLKTCPIKVKKDVDLAVSCSRTDRCWTLQILPNNLNPEVPTTVNVSVGPDET